MAAPDTRLRANVNRFVDEAKRRKVIQTAGVYLVFAFATMQVVDAVFQYLPFRDPEAVGRGVLAVLVIGFPIALGLSWILDVAPPQLKRELSREDAERAVDSTVRLEDLRPDSVAVLPFENLSNDPDDLYFSDGITGDVISALAQIRDLRVLSRTSVMRYRDVSKNVREIASELGVATVITGSVRHVGSRVRILAEMVDARTDDHLWSETYDRELEDLFEVQTDVADRVARAVRRELTPDARKSIETRGTTDPSAYDLYLKAKYLWNQRNEGAVSESLRFFERAIERDAHFALAHAGLAEALTVLGLYGTRAPSEVLPQARAAAEGALAIDPTLGEAVAVKACISAIYDWDWADAEVGFGDALVLAPSYATAHQWYAANVLTPLGRFDDALLELDRASELDPGSGPVAVSRAIVSFYARDFEKARMGLEETVARYPNFALARAFLGQCQMLLGERESALESLAQAAEASGRSSETLAMYAHGLAVAGRDVEATALLDRLERRSGGRYVSPALIAQILVALGRNAEAIIRLEEALAARATDLIWLGVRPSYDPLRSDPAFRGLLDRLQVGSQPASR